MHTFYDINREKGGDNGVKKEKKSKKCGVKIFTPRKKIHL
jgi:hypothetical protein